MHACSISPGATFPKTKALANRFTRAFVVVQGEPTRGTNLASATAAILFYRQNHGIQRLVSAMGVDLQILEPRLDAFDERIERFV